MVTNESESDLQIQVADYLRLQYPDVMFHSDYGSGAKLTPGQAIKQKRQNGGRRAWPDMFIAEYVFDNTTEPFGTDLRPLFKRYENCAVEIGDEIGLNYILCGLYLELKKEGEKLYPGLRAKNRFKSKDGKEYKNEHLMEQADCLYDLRQRGYCAEFAIGFDEAKKIIDEYLGGKE